MQDGRVQALYFGSYGYYSPYYFDPYLLILVLPAFIFSVIASIRVRTVYSRMAKRFATNGLTGAQAAAEVLRYYGITNVQITSIPGKLTDHFNPKTNTIGLSESVYRGTSVADIGIACHEAGHAAQYAHSYLPIKLRNMILPIANIGSFAGIPLALIGFVLQWQGLVTFGLMLYAAIAVFQFITLPVEINASRRALKVINETGILVTPEERAGARSVLFAAAMTYIAALAVSLANLVRFIALFGRRNR